jgi:hypothetical protein
MVTSYVLYFILGYSYTSKTDHPEIGGDKDDELQTSHTLRFEAYSLAKGYSDRSKKVPLAAAPKQALLNPEEGARIQGGRAVEFGQKNAEMEDQKLVKPVTFPLNPPNQHDYSFEEQWGSTKLQFPPSDTKGAYSSLHLDLPAGVQEGSQSYSTNLVDEDFSQYPAAETAQLPSPDDDPYTYDSVVAEQPSSWSSDRYITREEPVFSSNAGDWAQAALNIGAQILEAEAVPSIDTKGGCSSSSLHLDLPAGVQEGSQSYSPNLVDEAVYQYPAAETAHLPSEQSDLSDYNSVNVVQPSTWSSAPYMTREEEPVFSSHTGHWAHVAPVETPAYPSYVADFGLDSTSSKAAAQPVLFKPLKKAPQLPSSKWLQRPKKVRDQTASTYIVQSKGSYRRSRQKLSKKKYFSGFPPPPPFVLMAETVRGKW